LNKIVNNYSNSVVLDGNPEPDDYMLIYYYFILVKCFMCLLGSRKHDLVTRMKMLVFVSWGIYCIDNFHTSVQRPVACVIEVTITSVYTADMKLQKFIS
jgi:hypothetical protein